MNTVSKVFCMCLLTISIFSLSLNAHSEIFHKKFTIDSATLIVELLDDDLVHFEYASPSNSTNGSSPIYQSPMVYKSDYSGPTSIQDKGNSLETSDLIVHINSSNLCVAVRDKTQANTLLTTVCPVDLSLAWKGINISPSGTENIYGLGQQFKKLGSADGDWLAHKVREAQPNGQAQAHGNGFMPFGQAGMVGNVQFPVIYSLGSKADYALFLDNVYKQQWDFEANWWEVRMWGDQIRFYIMSGADLPDLRKDYMELVGRPPVPPKKAFGLWLSEFGYKNWNEVDTLLSAARTNNFPIDGFVLDLFWFGGIKANNPDSPMGKLDWDTSNNDGNDYYFPDPAGKVALYQQDNISLVAIEESYINKNTATYNDMMQTGNYFSYAKSAGKCDDLQQGKITHINDWFGDAAMLDWSDTAGAGWLHLNRRFPNLSNIGITSHWTDLGEPEKYNPSSCYDGLETAVNGLKNSHGDIHNLYNFLWNKSIYEGYYQQRDKVDERSFIVTRSGTSGIQRFGAAMWSGDIGSNLDLLASHSNAQLHMSFSGIDYYGADIGGFRREGMPYNQDHSGNRQYEDELYTQWFANGAWFDVPVRPHTDNAFQSSQRYETAPYLVGYINSNRENIRQRYALIPYYYSLAYRAFLEGEPVMPPPLFYYQDDINLREMGHEKMIGKDLLVGVVANHGEYQRNMYLPAGKWVNYHSNEWLDSQGQWLNQVPVYRNKLFRLPAFVKAGAIIPQMYVDANSKDAFGHSKNGTAVHNELILKVVAGDNPAGFTLYEDDGSTLSYDAKKQPVYNTRTTLLTQKKQGDHQRVSIHASSGTYAGAPKSRQNTVQLILDNQQATDVKLNNMSLTQYNSKNSFDGASSGWYNAGNNVVYAKTASMLTSKVKYLDFYQQSTPAISSAYFACDNGWTNPGDELYLVGSIVELGNWNLNRAIKMNPSVYHAYISNPPPNHNGPGPSAPVWTKIVAPLPVNTVFTWKCVKKLADNIWVWQPGDNNQHTTVASGYSGMTMGSF
ncbi:glycoside hydrolase, family 31 [Psychromonas ingrahamii 37]|uniref:Glycoside hydrolase, family 31 n=1 Tax=Psychromonas ingrahamii (strain DSM 17664 / CCUG 51855 / 37) TaxID=357804 RepID=A1SXN5_PSYIN|nr:TIM-barrel domain-containing protein [Psychromonas ingrahamii]ABM04250.1 glycoside hydrolase, family 31 [Psychromonas ingrahamii 37]